MVHATKPVLLRATSQMFFAAVQSSQALITTKSPGEKNRGSLQKEGVIKK